MRKGAPKETNVSFLRRTQYISAANSQQPRHVDMSRNPALRPKPRPRRPDDEMKNDPTYIKKYITKGFDIAYPEDKHEGKDDGDKIAGLRATKEEIDAWNKPVHPANQRLKVVESYPIIPDLDAFTDTAGLMAFKFDKPPVPPLPGNKRDARMDVALLQPANPSDKIREAWEHKVMLHRTKPDAHPDPGPLQYDYNLYLPDSSKKDIVSKVQEQFYYDGSSRDNDNPELYTHVDSRTGRRFTRYDFVRRYETASQLITGATDNPTDVMLCLVDPSAKRKINPAISPNPEEQSRHSQKGAYYTTIISRVRIAPERSRMLAAANTREARLAQEPDFIDNMNIIVRDPVEEEVYKRAKHRGRVDVKFRNFLENAEKRDQEEGHEVAARRTSNSWTKRIGGMDGAGDVRDEEEGSDDGRVRRRQVVEDDAEASEDNADADADMSG